MLHAMIMAGGGGTRFWPRSRQKRPKQFLTLTGERTLLQQTIDRIEAQVPPENTWIITGKMYQEETSRQVPARRRTTSSASRAGAIRRLASAWGRP